MHPLKKEPARESGLEDEALYGALIEILEQAGKWYKVCTHYGYKGYLHASALLADTEAAKRWKAEKKKIVLQSYADVLTAPKVQANRLLSLTQGALVAAGGSADENGWIMVGLCNGTIGYIKEKFLGCDTGSMDQDLLLLRDTIPLGRKNTTWY